MPERECAGCGRPIGPDRAHLARVKFCTRRCAVDHHNRDFRRRNPLTVSPLGRATTGAASELIVAADLLMQGYHVFRALSPNSTSDLVLLIDRLAYRVEVRTGHVLKHDEPSCPV